MLFYPDRDYQYPPNDIPEAYKWIPFSLKMAAVSPLAFIELPKTLLFGADPLHPFPKSLVQADTEIEIAWLEEQQKK